MAISSSLSPYNSYTSASICRSVAPAFDLALEHDLDVWRPLGRELFVQVHAFGSALDQRDHPVVPRDVGGGGEVNGADAVRNRRLGQQYSETGLSKVVICGKCIGDVHLLHDHKRHAVRQAPLFVGSRLKQTKCLMVELIRQ